MDIHVGVRNAPVKCRLTKPSNFKILGQVQGRHDDVIKWKHFPRNWPFVRGIHRSPVNSPHKGQWRGALMFSLICVWINAWVNNREAGDLRCYRAHYDVIVMVTGQISSDILNFLHTNYQMHSLSFKSQSLYSQLLWTRFDKVDEFILIPTTFLNFSRVRSYTGCVSIRCLLWSHSMPYLAHWLQTLRHILLHHVELWNEITFCFFIHIVDQIEERLKLAICAW